SMGAAAMSDVLEVAASIGKVQPRLIIGSPSGDGDRFWVKGSSNNGNDLACIQRTFAQRTDPVTSFQLAATPVVTEKGRATTYSYSKAWVLRAADGIDACRGKVGFGRTTLSRASQMRASGERNARAAAITTVAGATDEIREARVSRGRHLRPDGRHAAVRPAAVRRAGHAVGQHATGVLL